MRRIAIVGFDSLDIDLVKRWAAAGEMPTFRRLLRESYARSVRNPNGFEAGSVWPSFSTGYGPAEHGQFDGMQCFDRQAYEKRRLHAHELVKAPFWRQVADAGKRVAVVDMPYSFREEDLHGIQVVDWLTHVSRPVGISTWPTGLARDIVAKHGRNPFDSRLGCPTNFADLASVEAVHGFTESLLRRVEQKRDCALSLYHSEPWPLFITVFHDAHDVGHMCWHLHDERHERHDVAIADAVGDPVRNVYVALDRALETLLATFDDETTVIVYCSHGMRPERTASGFLDDILMNLNRAYDGSGSAMPASGRGVAARAYRAAVPRVLRARVRRTQAYDRARRKARTACRMARPFFELAANHATGGVRINLEGRESQGLVAPGEAFDRLCERLIADLREVVNIETGSPIVTAATLTSDLHAGPMRAALPDILLDWDTAAPVRAVRSPRIGVLRNPRRRQRSGDHGRERGAVFVVTTSGYGDGLEAPPIEVTGLAPSIMRSLGLPTADFEIPPVEELVRAIVGDEQAVV